MSVRVCPMHYPDLLTLHIANCNHLSVADNDHISLVILTDTFNSPAGLVKYVRKELRSLSTVAHLILSFYGAHPQEASSRVSGHLSLSVCTAFYGM